MSRNSNFQTVHTEGGLLPADQLSRIAILDADGVKPADYDLPPGEKVNEAISQCWARLCKYWTDFQESRDSLPEDQPGTDITNQKWLLPLFRELGYGKLTTSKSPEIDGKIYPITRYHGHLPIHFVGCNIALDKRSPGVKGAATGTPHGLVQEFLNRSEGHLWAFVSNGRQLRILRDNVALSRQSYIEFDMESMFEGEVYSDFALLWMICHVTRTEGERPELCWLEKWSAAAREHGTRVLENLRNGVERAIEALGRGFISHPTNDVLRQKIRDGQLDKQALYHQVLRIVYRLLFLFVAEDRDLLHPPDTPNTERELYDQHYSARRLRDLAGQIKGSRHGDLWHVLSLTFAALSGDESAENVLKHLGLPALGSHLWRLDETPDILGPSPGCPELSERVWISNDDLLEAIRHLAYVQQEQTLQSVNYRDLGSEELGSVYESLLELQPDIHPEARKFELRTVTGSERKTTGSYYTPDSLVQCLLDSALEPVITDRLGAAVTAEDKQQALLNLKVCDPACGSGHFLIAASHRIARHLARLQAIAAGEAEPTPDIYQRVLRDVIAHCVYGVDSNPMAVELCKVSLWLEALDPSKPLAFLDHHIQCGNSLLGTTPALIKGGVPDEAFKPIEGDDKFVCRQLKKDNKSERQGQRRLWGAMPSIHMGNMAQTLASIDAEDDSTPGAVAAKEKRYQEFVSSSDYENASFLADAWCAAFVWPKFDLSDPAVTTETIRRIENNPREYPESSPIRDGVRNLSMQYQFFHWHLVFPEVFRVPAEGEEPENEQTGLSGGFDCVLGNPPWERVKLQEKEWFAERCPEIANAPNAAARKRLIEELETNNADLYGSFTEDLRRAEGESHLLRNSGRFPLCGRGDINVYSVFAEGMRNLLDGRGRVGCVLPTGIVTDDTTKFFFQDVVERKSLISIFDFENREGFFPAVDSRMKFCMFTCGSVLFRSAPSSDFLFFAHVLADLHDPKRRYSLTREDMQTLNPNTLTCPVFRTRTDMELCLAFHRGIPVFRRERADQVLSPWDCDLERGFRQGEDEQTLNRLGFDRSKLLYTSDEVRDNTKFVPLVEGKTFNLYDHRAASIVLSKSAVFRPRQPVDTPVDLHKDPSHAATPYYWVEADVAKAKFPWAWFVVHKKVTSATNERTMVATVLGSCAVNDTVHVFTPGRKTKTKLLPLLGANLCSFILDYVGRQKLGGNAYSMFIAKQLPLIPPQTYSLPGLWTGTTQPMRGWLIPRALELTYTAWDLEAFAQDCGWQGPPIRWDEERRFLIRCELDAAFFHLYLGTESDWRESGSKELIEYCPTPRHAVEYIMETFPIVKRKDEQAHGHFRTKDTILDIYDVMAEAIAANEAARAAGQSTNVEYQTILDPPPGPPTDTSGNFIPYAEWTDEIRERYKNTIHPPKETKA